MNKVKDTFVILGFMAAAAIIAPIWIGTALLVLGGTSSKKRDEK